MSSQDPKQTKELLSGGMDLRQADLGLPFIQNLIKKNGSWETRSGFGVIAQHDSTLLAGINAEDEREIGFIIHCGSFAFETDFGHKQIISVVKTKAFSSTQSSTILSADVDQQRIGADSISYSVLIYDLSSEHFWEEIIYHRTAEDVNGPVSMVDRHGVYETTTQRDFVKTKVTNDQQDSCFFEQHLDSIYFGNSELGIFCYRPSIFRGNRIKQIDNLLNNEQSLGFSESSIVKKLVFGDGQLGSDGFVYFTKDELPTFTDICTLDDRMIFAHERSIYFSDPDEPHAIIDANFQTIGCEREITAVASILGRILIFTSNETYVYVPIQSALISGGRLFKLSDSIGCVSPQSLLKVESFLCWVDRNGIYLSNGSDITTISEPIERFFLDHVSNPMTNYFIETGISSMVTDQPKIDLIFDESVHLCYDPKRQYIIATWEDLNISWVYQLQEKVWVIWNFESIVNEDGRSDSPDVRSIKRMDHPFFVAIDDRIFSIILHEQVVNDSTIQGGTSGGATSFQYTNHSILFLEYERGGGLDRSSSSLEDQRLFAGEWKKSFYVPTSDGYFYVGQPWLLDQGYTLPEGSVVGSSISIMVPIYLTPPSLVTVPDRFSFRFLFDNTHWKLIFNAGSMSSAELDFDLPTERMVSVDGYSKGAPIAGLAEVVCYNLLSGLVDPNGDEIRIRWDGASSPPGSYPNRPNMVVNIKELNPLIYLPFQRLTGSVANDTVLSLGFSQGIGTPSTFRPTGSAAENMGAFFWYESKSYPSSSAADDANAQNIDWMYQSMQIGDGLVQLKPRGIITKAVSRGESTDQLVSQWPYGLYNTNLSVNYKNFSAQIPDLEVSIINPTPGNEEIRNKDTVVDQMQDSSTLLMKEKTFNNFAKWSTLAGPLSGNILIDNEQYHDIVTSDGRRGERFSYLLFGFIQNKAEKIVLQSSKAMYRVLGLLRRSGR